MIVFLDLDGVLANFVEGTIRAHERSESHDDCRDWNYFEKWGLTASQFWSRCRGRNFWLGLEPYPDAVEIVNQVSRYEHYFLTAPSEDAECPGAKVEWLKKHFDVPMSRIIVGQPKHLLAKCDRVLIDDSKSNLDAFMQHGGSTIGWARPWNEFPRMESLSETLDVLHNFFLGNEF